MENKEGIEMMPFKKCPVCGGEVVEKDVEKLVKGGGNTAAVRVKAEVCLHCGERLYSRETVSRFEEIRKKLEQNDVDEFKQLGHTYQVVA
jgi:YgiT-type zinc finger domain-containing protein